MRSRPVRAGWAAAALALAALGVQEAAASSTSAPMNLAQLVHGASVIVRGTVTDVKTVNAGTLPATEITLDVVEGIRGVSSKTFTFRQIGLSGARPAADGRRYVGLTAGVPQYTQGEQVFLFLGRESAAGLRMTVGLGQGTFRYAAGSLQNDFANRGLFVDVPMGRAKASGREESMLATQKGVVDAATFAAFVDRGVRQNWWGGPTITPGRRGNLDRNPGGAVLNRPTAPARR